MTTGCNIWMICLKLNWFIYNLSRGLGGCFVIQHKQIEVRLAAIKSTYFSKFAHTPFNFLRTFPLKAGNYYLFFIYFIKSRYTSLLCTTANQDVHAFTQKSSSIFPITPFNLKLETSALNFKNTNSVSELVRYNQRSWWCDTLKSRLSNMWWLIIS